MSTLPAVAASPGLPGASRVPLAVDLDGTLVSSDLLLESVFILAKRRPLKVLSLPIWLARGRAQLKQRLASEARPDMHTLPYNRELVDYLKAEKQRGRPLVLATASDESVARDVAQEIGLFDAVYASDGATNLDGERKRDKLVAEFGARGFDYAGNGRADRPVWDAAREVIVVNSSSGLGGADVPTPQADRVFRSDTSWLPPLWQSLRVDHWVKNLLVFLPLLVAHRLYEIGPFAHAAVAFVAFCFCASGIYLLNDLIDLPRDRLHPHKKERPLASGRLSIGRAVALIPLLLVLAVAVSLTQPPALLGVLAIYCILMVAYCLRLRDFLVVDVVTLAVAHTLRAVAGSAASGVPMSPWLLAFCLLFFLGLALLKRYAELVALRAHDGDAARARAYRVRHSGAIAFIGCASGYLSVAVLAYCTGFDHGLYTRYSAIWIGFALMLYWIAHIWLRARAGRIDNDPVIYALGDRPSQIAAILGAAIALISA